MRISTKAITTLLLVFLCVNFTLSDIPGAAIDKKEINKKLAAIVKYEQGMSREPLIAVEKLIRQSQNQPEQRKYIELKLSELLSEVTLECKSFICRQLWFIGTADSVPAIAELLKHEETADIACYAIGQNPSPAAAKALRDALDKVPETVQIRIIHLLGDRRDTQSVEVIGKLVFDSQSEVGEAAIAALGKIGGTQARKILVEVRGKGDSELQFAATDAYLRCAEGLVAEGKVKQAMVIYRELAGKDETAIIRSAAIKGLADVGRQEAVPAVIASLHDDNRMVKMTAMSCVRTMLGSGVTKRFAAELPKMPPDEQVLLIGALANRQDLAALPAITTAAGSPNVEVRKAAMYALGHFGDASCIELLVRAAESKTPEEKKAAIFALKNVGGTGADDAIIKSMQNSQASVRSQLIEVLAERNAVGAVPALLGEAVNPDTKVRRAAFKALGRLGGKKDLPSLVKLLVKLEDDSNRKEAERAVVVVSRKISEQSRQADAVLANLQSEKRVAVRCSLLRVLGGIANGKALETLTSASKETNPTVQDTSVRALAKWPNAAAIETLLYIFQTTGNEIHRALVLRGCVRLLASATGRLVQETLWLYEQALHHARRPEEKKLLLSGLANVSDLKTLNMVKPYLHDEAVKAEAALAMIKIAGTIMKTHPDQTKTAMNNLLAVLEDEGLRNQAEDIIRQIQTLEETARETER